MEITFPQLVKTIYNSAFEAVLFLKRLEGAGSESVTEQQRVKGRDGRREEREREICVHGVELSTYSGIPFECSGLKRFCL